jgi:hypothetical protein
MQQERAEDFTTMSFTICNQQSGDQIKKTEIGRACSTYGERRGAYRVLMRKPERKTQG